jgi:threonine dehydratase
MTAYAADLAAIRGAAERLRGKALLTPVFTSSALDAIASASLFFKAENLQRIGAFKFRGACNAVSLLGAHDAERGVVTHSSGNHAQALALAAKLRGIPAHVVMPQNSLPVKLRAVEGYGARVYPCQPTLAAREALAAEVAASTGATLIPPFDHPDVIAGQGTTLLELVEQVRGLDAIVAPIGGGGLISGIALAAREIDARIRVIAAEPAAADDAARSKASGRFTPQLDPKTIADGLRTSLGELTWPVVRDVVDRVVTVTEAEIVAALRLVFERLKLVIEPSAAVAFAAVLTPGFRELGHRRVGIVLSGGNVDLDGLSSLLSAGS